MLFSSHLERKKALQNSQHGSYTQEPEHPSTAEQVSLGCFSGILRIAALSKTTNISSGKGICVQSGALGEGPLPGHKHNPHASLKVSSPKLSTGWQCLESSDLMCSRRQ